MSKGLGGLVVAELMVDDVERYLLNRRDRRAARHAAKASRARRRGGSAERRAGRAGTPAVEAPRPRSPDP